MRSEYGINVLEVSRPAQPRVVAKIGAQRLMLQGSEPKLIHPENDLTLQRDDLLIFSDYARVGLPLALLAVITAMIALPILFPLYKDIREVVWSGIRATEFRSPLIDFFLV